LSVFAIALLTLGLLQLLKYCTALCLEHKLWRAHSKLLHVVRHQKETCEKMVQEQMALGKAMTEHGALATKRVTRSETKNMSI
jgi:hypothetical protein